MMETVEEKELVASLLKEAILGESGAVKKYREYEGVATKENHTFAAHLFRVLAVAEIIHIKNHKSALGEDFSPEINEQVNLGTTSENLQDGIAGEKEEFKNMYPSFLKQIKKIKNSDYAKVAALSMKWAKEAEKEHYKLLKRALNGVESGETIEVGLYVCKVCGNIELKVGESTCAICGHDSSFFEKID